MSLGSTTPIAHINLASLASPLAAPGRYPLSANASAINGGSLSVNPALAIDTGHHTPNFDGVPTRFNVTHKQSPPQISLAASFEAADAMMAAASYRQQSLSHFYPSGKSPQSPSPQAKKTFPGVFGNSSEGVSSSLSTHSSPASPPQSPLNSHPSPTIVNQAPVVAESKSLSTASAHHLVLEQQESERRQREHKVRAHQQQSFCLFASGIFT
jgi:hypothetical protein